MQTEIIWGEQGNDLIYGSHKVTGTNQFLHGNEGDDKIILGDDMTGSR